MPVGDDAAAVVVDRVFRVVWLRTSVSGPKSGWAMPGSSLKKHPPVRLVKTAPWSSPNLPGSWTADCCQRLIAKVRGKGVGDGLTIGPAFHQLRQIQARRLDVEENFEP